MTLTSQDDHLTAGAWAACVPIRKKKRTVSFRSFKNTPLYKGAFVPLDIKEYKIIELIWTINCYDGLRTFYILLKIYSAFFFSQLQEKFFQMIKSAGLCLTRYGISVSSSLEFENMRSCAHFQFIVDKSSLTIKGSELVTLLTRLLAKEWKNRARCGSDHAMPPDPSLSRFPSICRYDGAVSNNKDESYEP